MKENLTLIKQKGKKHYLTKNYSDLIKSIRNRESRGKRRKRINYLAKELLTQCDENKNTSVLRAPLLSGLIKRLHLSLTDSIFGSRLQKSWELRNGVLKTVPFGLSNLDTNGSPNKNSFNSFNFYPNYLECSKVVIGVKFSILSFELERALVPERLKMSPSFDDFRPRDTNRRIAEQDIEMEGYRWRGGGSRETQIQKIPSYLNPTFKITWNKFII